MDKMLVWLPRKESWGMDEEKFKIELRGKLINYSIIALSMFLALIGLSFL